VFNRGRKVARALFREGFNDELAQPLITRLALTPGMPEKIERDLRQLDRMRQVFQAFTSAKGTLQSED
jgi:hypothetical protein